MHDITYHAVKILTVHATEESENGNLLELEVLETISTLRGRFAVNRPYLFDHFTIKGRKGKHFCLVLSVLSTDISSFRKSAPSQMLKSPTVKIIVAQVVRALVVLHNAGIIHGGKQHQSYIYSLNTALDLEPENVLFYVCMRRQTSSH